MPLDDDLVHLAQVALLGEPHRAQAAVRRLARQYRDGHPEVAQRLIELLRGGITRGVPTAVDLAEPADSDTRLPLFRKEIPGGLEERPFLDAVLHDSLMQLVSEQQRAEHLLSLGLEPTRTALLVGAPGTGKTLTARWMAEELKLPLIILDLAAVMSSFLGKTGANVRRVLDYARQTPCVLLLDELDAIAKRRDDLAEVGELKRLVTVLLQEVDNWPAGNILLAATNHEELLDPAVWRRFEVVFRFPLPDEGARRAGIAEYVGQPQDEAIIDTLVYFYEGQTLSRIRQDVFQARRRAALSESTLEENLLAIIKLGISELPQAERGRLATRLVSSGRVSQRRASELTGVSRDTIRKRSTKRDDGEA